jgi:hypothetical protein
MAIHDTFNALNLKKKVLESSETSGTKPNNEASHEGRFTFSSEVNICIEVG